MEYKIVNVVRNEFGKAVIAEVIFEGRKTVFWSNEGKPMRNYKSAGLPDKVFKKARKKIAAIFSEKRMSDNGRELIKEAKLINDQIDKLRSGKRKPIIMAELVKAVIKKEIKKEIPYLCLNGWQIQFYYCGVRFMEGGWLKVRRFEKKNNILKKIWQKVPDIDTAIKIHDHILEKYQTSNKGEITEISNFEEIISTANLMLLKWPTLDLDERTQIEKSLLEVIMSMKNYRNDLKVKAKYQIEMTAKLRDCKKRLNPSAMAARTIASLDALGRRLMDLKIIMPFIAYRREMLILEKQFQTSILRKTASSTVFISRILVGFMKADFISLADRKKKSGYAIRDIEEIRSKLIYVITAPFLARAIQADSSLFKAEQAIKEGDFKKAANLVNEAQKILS